MMERRAAQGLICPLKEGPQLRLPVRAVLGSLVSFPPVLSFSVVNLSLRGSIQVAIPELTLPKDAPQMALGSYPSHFLSFQPL